MAKFGMSMCVLGMAEEFKGDGIAVNALWPRTGIATAAIQNVLGGDDGMTALPQARDHGRRRPRDLRRGRRATAPATSSSTTRCWRAEGVTDFDQYAVSPGTPLMPDFFVPAPGARTVVGRG